MMSDKLLILGQTLAFASDPFRTGPEDAVKHNSRGAILIENGLVSAMGDAETLRRDHPDARVSDQGDNILTAGFVDAHVHYPQTAMIASWGKRLLDWLNDYTFPEEMRFSDADYATEIAERYFDLAISYGTTSMVSFATIHPESVDAFFTAAQARGMRAVTGKCCMDRNAPPGLCDEPVSAYDDSKKLLEKWHGVDRLSYAVTPRFSPTSSEAQLEALGALWAEHPDCLMQTHLSEQTEEIAWVRSLFPDARDYLDTYEKYGLIGRGALFGHAIHLEDRERDRLRESGASLIHCPTSNMFIGSGLFRARALAADEQRIGLATDTGGGSSFSMLRTMAAAYEIGQLGGTALHPAELWWLATCGSAHAIGMGDRIGNLRVGAEADIVSINLASTPAIAQRSAVADTLWEALFPTIMMGDDRAIDQVWISGKPQAKPDV